MILTHSCPIFSFEVRGDMLAGTPLPVGIGNIDVICRDMSDLSKERTAVPYRVDEPVTLVKGIKANMIDEVGPIKLDHVYLRSELYLLNFLTLTMGHT